jgi:hypothetical protein
MGTQKSWPQEILYMGPRKKQTQIGRRRKSADFTNGPETPPSSSYSNSSLRTPTLPCELQLHRQPRVIPPTLFRDGTASIPVVGAIVDHAHQSSSKRGGPENISASSLLHPEQSQLCQVTEPSQKHLSRSSTEEGNRGS